MPNSKNLPSERACEFAFALQGVLQEQEAKLLARLEGLAVLHTVSAQDISDVEAMCGDMAKDLIRGLLAQMTQGRLNGG
jgi:hypothetical protein